MQTSIDQNNRYILVSGNTFPHKQELKTLGGFWESDNKAWKFRIEFREQVERFVASVNQNQETESRVKTKYVAAKPENIASTKTLPTIVRREKLQDIEPQQIFVYNTVYEFPIGINKEQYKSDALFMVGQIYHIIKSQFNRVILRYAKSKYGLDQRKAVLLANYRSDQLAISLEDVELETLANYSWSKYPLIREEIQQSLFKQIVKQLETDQIVTAEKVTQLIQNGLPDLELSDLFRNPKIINIPPGAISIKYCRISKDGLIYNVGNIFTLKTPCGYKNYKITSNVITSIVGTQIKYSKITVLGYGYVLPDSTEYVFNLKQVDSWDRYQKNFNPCKNN